ncbi:hypothetical protein LTR50_001103 [Elasticomyces elasticus]|nr:hypothetical protein LTR50_001103 [Elasticomyces elasticus]
MASAGRPSPSFQPADRADNLPGNTLDTSGSPRVIRPAPPARRRLTWVRGPLQFGRNPMDLDDDALAAAALTHRWSNDPDAPNPYEDERIARLNGEPGYEYLQVAKRKFATYSHGEENVPSHRGDVTDQPAPSSAALAPKSILKRRVNPNYQHESQGAQTLRVASHTDSPEEQRARLLHQTIPSSASTNSDSANGKLPGFVTTSLRLLSDFGARLAASVANIPERLFKTLLRPATIYTVPVNGGMKRRPIEYRPETTTQTRRTPPSSTASRRASTKRRARANKAQAAQPANNDHSTTSQSDTSGQLDGATVKRIFREQLAKMEALERETAARKAIEAEEAAHFIRTARVVESVPAEYYMSGGLGDREDEVPDQVEEPEMEIEQTKTEPEGEGQSAEEIEDEEMSRTDEEADATDAESEEEDGAAERVKQEEESRTCEAGQKLRSWLGTWWRGGGSRQPAKERTGPSTIPGQFSEDESTSDEDGGSTSSEDDRPAWVRSNERFKRAADELSRQISAEKQRLGRSGRMSGPTSVYKGQHPPSPRAKTLEEDRAEQEVRRRRMAREIRQKKERDERVRRRKEKREKQEAEEKAAQAAWDKAHPREVELREAMREVKLMERHEEIVGITAKFDALSTAKKAAELVDFEQRLKKKAEARKAAAEEREKQAAAAERLRLQEEQQARAAEEARQAAQRAAEEAERQKKEQERLKAEAEAAKKRLVQPLSTEWEHKIGQVMATPNEGTYVTKDANGNDQCNRRHLGQVLPTNHLDDPSGWLGDMAVDSWYEALCHAAQQKQGWIPGPMNDPHTPAPLHTRLATQWYTKYKQAGKSAAGLKRWLKKAGIKGANVFDTEAVYLPTNPGNHWVLLVISGKKRSIEYLDSLHGSGAEYFRAARQLLAVALEGRYVADEWTEVQSNSAWQNNANDCGVFACFNGFARMKGLEPKKAFAARDTEVARKVIVATLVNGGFKGEFEL